MFRIDRSETKAGHPTHEEIAREAYAIYLANGSRDGYDIEDWLEAERRLNACRQLDRPQQSDAFVQHVNDESRHKYVRPIPDRRRNPRPSFPAYLRF
jgi:Protein of unknown function (DUF2934)